jgi:N-methylhydantoinase A
MSAVDILVGCDVGGTFTDFAISIPSRGALILHKVPSTSRAPDQAIIDGLREALAAHDLSPGQVARLAHGTTVGTNALIQRRCGKVAVVTGEGMRDLLEIGRQTRPHVYAIHRDHPKPLAERRLRVEVPERMLADGTVFVPLDEARLRVSAEWLRDEGVDCVVVCFLHAYAHPAHEQRAVALLRAIMPAHVEVLASSEVYPEFREYERFSTAVLNGALLTIMKDYLDRLQTNAQALGVRQPPKISQSAGGLMSIAEARRLPIRASLSGPAAGVLAAARHGANAGIRDLITLDMGGTSADVSLLRDATPSEVKERSLAGFPIRLPALDVNAVGAGGGSIAWIDRDGLLKVGPQSAGAQPGPACYALGGTEATVTDANVFLGRLDPVALLGGRMPIRKERAATAIEALATKLGLAAEETALGILSVACATMVKAIRTVSVERGLNPSEFALFPFGGAGPLHATEVARQLDMTRVLVPLNPGILCAEGALNSMQTADFVATLLVPFDRDALAPAAKVIGQLQQRVAGWFDREAIDPSRRLVGWSADLRYFGQNYEIQIRLPGSDLLQEQIPAILDAFHRQHETLYGFASPRERVQIVNIKAKATGLLDLPAIPTLAPRAPGQPIARRMVVFERGRALETPVFARTSLAAEQVIQGPAIIDQLDATTLIFPGDRVDVDRFGNLLISVSGA